MRFINTFTQDPLYEVGKVTLGPGVDPTYEDMVDPGAEVETNRTPTPPQRYIALGLVVVSASIRQVDPAPIFHDATPP